MWFTRISIGNPVLATMMMVAFVVLGLFSYQRLRVDQFPDVTFPIVVVQTEYPGAAPETVESDITRKVEEAVNTINGINSLTSRSYEGQSIVIIEFALTVDPAADAAAARRKLKRAGFSDRDLWDIISVTAFFNMTNRVAAASDMMPNSEYLAAAR